MIVGKRNLKHLFQSLLANRLAVVAPLAALLALGISPRKIQGADIDVTVGKTVEISTVARCSPPLFGTDLDGPHRHV